MKELEPDCQSYTEVYHRAGLLGPRTVLAHCVHLSQVLHLYKLCIVQLNTWVCLPIPTYVTPFLINRFVLPKGFF